MSKANEIIRLCCRYFMTCACVDYWGVVLPQLPALKGFSLVPLHGKMKQALIVLCSMILHKIQMFSFIELAELLGGSLCRIPLEKRKATDNPPDVVPLICSAAKKDRDVMERGLRAFVSLFRAYKEHHCSYIFRWKELEVGKLGMGYGLLQLPSTSELNNHSLSNIGFTPAEDVKLEDIKFKDKSREKQRKKNLKIKKEPKAKKPSKNSSTAPAVARKKTAKQRRAAQSIEDDDDLAREYRLLKKLKKGTIDETEYAKLTGTEDL
ncbi:DEAD-box ATP-dependent RNA helicase 18 [Euphorbia peplus]|nr:DEAD-box ATP-dependent RNA helicase 18 [Euphorbia peplus]